MNTKVLITGASSGIGKAFSHELVKTASTLVLLGRNMDRLDDSKNELEYLFPDTQIETVQCDFSECNVRQLMQQADALWQRFGYFDVLVFCAGVSYQEPFMKTDANKMESQVSVNLMAPMAFTRVLGARMLEENIKGKILFVSSLMGLVAAPSFATYSATKFALIGLARSLRKELYFAGIGVSVIIPTLTATPMVQKFKNFVGVEMVTPEYVAQQGVRRGVHGSEQEVIIGWQAHGAVLAKQFFPGLVERAMRIMNPLRNQLNAPDKD